MFAYRLGSSRSHQEPNLLQQPLCKRAMDRSQLASMQIAPMGNIGHSCYINASLAALYASKHVRQHIAMSQHQESCLCKILIAAAGSRGRIVHPDEFLKEPFYSREQRDAQEFLGEVLSAEADAGVEALCKGRLSEADVQSLWLQSPSSWS